MSGLAFLLIALAISLVGSVVLWLRTRRPHSLDSGIESFRREMQALSPDGSRRRVHASRVDPTRGRQRAG